jgi:aminopeptidase Y
MFRGCFHVNGATKRRGGEMLREMGHTRLVALAAGAVLATGCGGATHAARTAAPAPAAPLDAAGHLRALAALTRDAGGTRAAGSRGYEAAADYVAGVLQRAGYRVTRQAVAFPFFDERSPARLATSARALRRGRDFRTLTYSGSGTVRGRVRAIRLDLGRSSDSGCAAPDYARVRRGEVALVQRGTCTLRRKALLARRAGAGAVLIVNDGRPGRTDALRGTLGAPGVSIPALALSTAAGRALARARGSVRVAVDATSERRSADNVLAERPGSDGPVVMAGAHLDSVPEGPGVNDDGSGVAALLAVAQRREAPGVRFGFWTAEEIGLVGSRRYVRSLAGAERRRIAAYVNLDMVASPNAEALVYGVPRVARVLRDAVGATGRTPRETDLGGASDHASFAGAGIPVGGLFTGASEAGPDGRPHDACYHRRCDTLGHANLAVLADMTAALAAVIDSEALIAL